MTSNPPSPIYPPPAPGAFERLKATVAATAAVLTGRVAIALGLRRPHEGWRRTVGILLRSESTRFAMSAFGLAVPAQRDGLPEASFEARIAAGLLEFLTGEPDAHFCLEWEPPVTVRRQIASVELVVLRFGATGALDSIAPISAARDQTLSPELSTHVHHTIVQAYNATAHLPEVHRTQELRARAHQQVDVPDAHEYTDRILGAACLSFESIDRADPRQRFAPPSFASRRSLGFGYQTWIARPDAATGSTDLWVSAQHVGLDGVPLQDLLNRLERVWGVAVPVVFPDPSGPDAFAGPTPCHGPGERHVDHLLTFTDLSPVLSLRRVLSARHAAAIGGEVTLGAVLGWLLSQDEEFRGVRIASTVDVAASAGYERDVDVVSLRAADYMAGPDVWSGFVEYAREFNRLIAAARTRTSPVRVGMQTAGLIPPWAHAALVRARPAALDETFGRLCVTIVRDARIFVGPMTDLGLDKGFFAIGSAGLRTADGRPVAAVSIKGPAGRVSHYPAVFYRVVDRAARLVAEMEPRSIGRQPLLTDDRRGRDEEV